MVLCKALVSVVQLSVRNDYATAAFAPLNRSCSQPPLYKQVHVCLIFIDDVMLQAAMQTTSSALILSV